MKKGQGIIIFISTLLTYFIVHIIYKLTGFYYVFGQINYKLFVDLLMWCVIYFIAYLSLKKLFIR